MRHVSLFDNWNFFFEGRKIVSMRKIVVLLFYSRDKASVTKFLIPTWWTVLNASSHAQSLNFASLHILSPYTNIHFCESWLIQIGN